MRLIRETLAFQKDWNTQLNFLLIKTFLTGLIIIFVVNFAQAFSDSKDLFAENGEVFKICFNCDNATDGGTIQGDEEDCPNPIFDPSLITSITLPTGGTGNLEYIWIFTTDDPNGANAQWTPILNTNSPEYDPTPINVTTHYRRCARRAGCVEYVAESNIVTKAIVCCDNVTDGGEICCDQSGCAPSFDPDVILNTVLPSGGTGNIEYLWYASIVGSPFDPSSPDWFEIPGSNAPNFDPGLLLQTTWYVRTSKRADCTDFDGVSNIIQITLIAAPILGSTISSEILCFGDTTGAIDLNVSGGLAPYQILWDNGIGSVEDPQNLGAGTYSVTVTDENSCSTNISVTLENPDSLQLEMSAVNVSCGGMGDGEASVNIIGGTADYSINWNTNPVQITDTITNLNPGTYIVNVTDANGCIATDSVEVSEAVDFILNSSGVDATCEGFSDGSAIVIVVSGGIPDFQYLWSDSNAQTTSTANNLPSGEYFVTVTDATGCQAIDTVIVDASFDVSVFMSADSVTCFGGDDGAVQIDSIVGGQASYSIDWSIGGNTNVLSVSNLVADIYSATVTDQNGCTAIESIEVVDGYEIEVIVNTENPTCLGLPDGSAKVAQINGGIAPFSYSWEPGLLVTDSISNLLPGTYTVTVTDANDCTVIGSGEVENGAPLTINTISNQETCLGEGDGSAAVISVPDGIAPFSYSWSTGSIDSLITNLTGGVYDILVTDAQGCIGTDSVVVQSGGVMSLGIDKMDIQCGNDANGTATVNIAGGTSGFTFLWNDPNAQTTQTASGLGAGTYSVVVTDAMGCTASDTVTIEAFSTILTLAESSPVTCNGGNDGSVAVTILNGNVTDYSIIWDTPHDMDQDNITGLAAGVYHVTVTDTLGCMGIDSIEVSEPSVLTLNISGTHSSCFGDSNGSASVSATGGWGGYAYIWNNSGGTSTITSLNAGDYQVVVTDSLGCADSISITITEPAPLTASFLVSDESCHGSGNGSINANVSGGTPDYQYNWIDPTLQDTSFISNVSSGDYALEIIDANGCSALEIANVGTETDLAIEVFGNDISCHGMNDGEAWVVVTGGSGTYAYVWNVPGGASTETVSNLSEGTYTVFVSDTTGCSISGNVTIHEPQDLTLTIFTTTVYCENDTNGEATTVIGGGTAPFNYNWSSGATTPSLLNIGSGNYFLTITDANSCTETANAIVEFTSDLSASHSSIPASCFGGSDGEATVNGMNGDAPYTVQWSTGDSGDTASNLSLGTYSATVTDASGCIFVETLTVGEADELLCSAQVSTNITTYQGNDGEATASGSGGTAPYTYEWDTDDLSPVATNLSAGDYYVTVTDANGCTCETSITLENPSKVGNFVWKDLNENGIQEVGEPGIENVKVILSGTTGGGNTLLDSTYTNSNGEYWFDGLDGGFYDLTFELLPTYMFSPKDEGNDNAIDSDVDQNGETTLFSVANSTLNEDWDAGMIQLDEKINIGDYVWKDVNRNGIQDTLEDGVTNVTVRLIEMPSGFVQASTTTNIFGFYQFNDVMPGDYVIEFVETSLPTGYIFTQPDQTSDEERDSDPNPVDGRTPEFEVLPFTPDNFSYDAGIYPECDNVTSGGTIIGDEELCGLGADPSIIESETLPTGGFGILEYLWLQSNIPIYNGPGDPNWIIIPNSNSPSYDPGPISQDTYYIRCARRAGCNDYIGETNIVSKIIIEYPLTNIEEFPAQLCDDEGGKFVASIAGGGAIYFWEFGNDANPQTASTRTVNDVSWNTPGFKPVILTVTRFGCSYSTSVLVEVIACPNGNPLIVFGDLNAEVIDFEVALSWSSAADDKNAVYAIQRSENSNEYKTIGALEGKDIEDVKEYDFMDIAPLIGKSYYRVKRMTGDRPVEFSEIVAINITPESNKNVHLYPNPFIDFVNLKVMSPNEEVIEIEVTNTFAQVIERMEIAANQSIGSIDFSHLANGMYYIRIHQKGKVDYTVKMFKTD